MKLDSEVDKELREERRGSREDERVQKTGMTSSRGKASSGAISLSDGDDTPSVVE